MRTGCVACAVLIACNADPSPVPGVDRLATLDITLEGDGSIDPTQIQLALVWARDAGVWPERLLEPQELLVVSHTLSWPVHFELAVTDAPTVDPYWSSPEVGYRQGKLVAYLDDNHNGKLDFTPINASAFTDRIVGFNPDARYVYYATYGTFAFNPDYVADQDAATPIRLFKRDAPVHSCHLLEDWEPHTAYLAAFGAILTDPTHPGIGPWDQESAMDSPCPGYEVPPLTARLSCDQPDYEFHALKIAPTSPFIAQACGEVMRVCQGWRTAPNVPGWPCPCDPTKYTCTQYEGGL